MATKYWKAVQFICFRQAWWQPFREGKDEEKGLPVTKESERVTKRQGESGSETEIRREIVGESSTIEMWELHKIARGWKENGETFCFLRKATKNSSYPTQA